MGGRTPILPQALAVRGRVSIQSERCKGCGFCVEYCPTQVLALSSKFNSKGYHYPEVVNDRCIDCRLCVTICPEYAIFAAPESGSSEAESVWRISPA